MLTMLVGLAIDVTATHG